MTRGPLTSDIDIDIAMLHRANGLVGNGCARPSARARPRDARAGAMMLKSSLLTARVILLF